MKGMFLSFFIITLSSASAQDSNMKKFKQLSGPEKCWVIFHPFVVKKALRVSEEARVKTKKIIQGKLLEGNGNGGQVDAFRHAFWMARLTQEIGWRKALKLGVAHEKGNFIDYKKRKLEDGVIPDEVSSKMDLYNNNVGIEIGKKAVPLELENIIIDVVLNGQCKMMKKDAYDNFIDCKGKFISTESLNGKWENNKCLVWTTGEQIR